MRPSRKTTPFQGLSTSLKEVTLSAGEAQLLALARAILHAEAGPCFSFSFDEATSSIEAATEGREMDIIIRDSMVLL